MMAKNVEKRGRYKAQGKQRNTPIKKSIKNRDLKKKKTEQG
jgi:hypothetical protein